MKTFLIIIGGIVIIGLIWIGILLTSPKTPQPTNITGSTLPVASSTNTTTGQNQPIPNQQQVAGTQPEIAQSFRGQIQNASLITLRGTTIVSTYALQEWGDENKGGQALLEYSPSQGWVLISMGGGAWSVSSLTQIGVPQLIAEQLVAGSK